MRRTSLTPEQALALAKILRAKRAALHLSMRQVEAVSGVNSATIVRLERGSILTPQPETLKALASALDLSVSDLFAVADWVPAQELPTFRPYLRAKYKQLPESAVAEMEQFFERLTKRHGAQGPADGEDER
ncbi:MAG: helix-turn-helix transcriptional regulator [Acidothermales bacterium]|nr:helix-turn-helix transcriptional regulator [Acidothermales bacterium]